MKVEKLRTQSDAELNKMLVDLKSQLFNLRFSNATGSLQNPLAINTCKKDIAKVMTILKERQLGISSAVVAPVAEAKKTTRKTTTKKVAQKEGLGE